MDKLEIQEILMQRGYSQRNAKLVADELQEVASQLTIFRDRWLEDGAYNADYVVGEYSISRLCNERRMNYPAALLTLDWLIKEPKAALDSLNRGIK